MAPRVFQEGVFGKSALRRTPRTAEDLSMALLDRELDALLDVDGLQILDTHPHPVV